MREYRMDLMEELPTMSWRRFSILASGLSGNSIYVNVLQARKEGKAPISDFDEVDPDQAERIAKQFFGK